MKVCEHYRHYVPLVCKSCRKTAKEEPMSEDDLEKLRLQLLKQVNEQRAASRVEAEDKYGQVWDTEELKEYFEVISFLAPFVAVRRRSDGKKGSLMFQATPRYYFSWQPDE